MLDLTGIEHGGATRAILPGFSVSADMDVRIGDFISNAPNDSLPIAWESATGDGRPNATPDEYEAGNDMAEAGGRRLKAGDKTFPTRI